MKVSYSTLHIVEAVAASSALPLPVLVTDTFIAVFQSPIIYQFTRKTMQHLHVIIIITDASNGHANAN